MNATQIRWTTLTWNPASGCQKLTAGCKHCYAETLAENKRGTRAFPSGFDLTLRPHKLDEPKRVKAPSLIFVNSMSDLFWEEITDEYRDRVLDVIEETPRHEYQVLTKRHENLLRYSQRRRLPPNFWAGVTAENAACLDSRASVLLKVRADIRFLSLEPALEDMDLRPYVCGRDCSIGGDGIQWVIWGGESGNHLVRPDVLARRGSVDRVDGSWVPSLRAIEWARHARDACKENTVPFFFKQWGGPRSTSGGKILDGRTWEEFPRLPMASVAPHAAMLPAERAPTQLRMYGA